MSGLAKSVWNESVCKGARAYVYVCEKCVSIVYYYCFIFFWPIISIQHLIQRQPYFKHINGLYSVYRLQ